MIASFIPGSDNAWANAAINAGKGCFVAEANGGSCGQGATSSVVRSLGGDSLPGNMLAGCVSARINGGSCSGGASNAFISYAADYAAQTSVGIYREAERMAREENARQAYQGNLVACGPCVGILVYAPEILGAGRFLWSASRAYMATRGLSRLLTMNEADKPVQDIVVPGNKYPESAGHIQDAQDNGQPDVLTIDRGGARGRRADAMAGQQVVPGRDRDEYPPALTAEGGRGASVRPISPSDNRGAGACIGAQCRGLPDGTRIRIIPQW